MDESEIQPLVSKSKSSNKKCNKSCVRNVMTFAGLWLAYLLMSVAYSVLSPFYPQEAAVFDVGSLTVGMVMGSAPLCVVFLSPIFGYFVPQIGLKFMLIAGSFLVGGSVVLTGFLVDMTSKWEFVMYSVLLRIVEGIGTAGYATGSFTIATLLYPSHTGTVVGLLEVGSGLGFVAGPPLGGILYNYGGFILPFVVTGGCVLLFVPFFICIIPRTDGKKQHMPYHTIGKLLLDIPFLLLLLCNVIVIAALGYFGPIMSPFLISKFKLSPIGIGIVFLIGPLFYMLSSIVVGKLSDILGPRYFIVIGLFLSGLGFVFVGPAPFIIDHSYLWLSCVSMVVLGIGIGFAVVPIFSDMLQITRRIDSSSSGESMNAIISGLSNSTLSFGEFLGPVVGGSLNAVMSFQLSSTLFGFVLLAKSLLLLSTTLIDRFLPFKKRTTEIINY